MVIHTEITTFILTITMNETKEISYKALDLTINAHDTKKEPSNFHCTFDGCKHVFNRKWKLDRHICSHTGKRPFNCTENGCEKSYQCRSHLQRHIKTAHLKLDRLACTFLNCNATFTCKSSLIKHCKNHSELCTYQCSECDEAFSTKNKLLRHEQLHDVSSSFLCDICKSNWSSQTLLRRHMRSHRLLHCEFSDCSFTCNSRPQMRSHEKNNHEIVLICDYCNKGFNNKAVLRDHITTHLPIDQRGLFFCPHRGCVRAYLQKRNLRHHLKVFHNRARYYCLYSDCYSSFVSQIRLECHVTRHHERNKKATEKLIENMTNILPLKDPTSHEPPIEPQCALQVISRDIV